jgi:alkylated DNA repair dioxygenase AlkB
MQKITTPVGSVFFYIKDYLPFEKRVFLTDYLSGMTDFKKGNAKDEWLPPREQKWYHFSGKYFDSSWNKLHDRWRSHVYDQILLDLQKEVDAYVNSLLGASPKFNSVLINKYRDGSDSIKLHRDSLNSFGPRPVIAGLSLGEKRTIKFVPNKKNTPEISLNLVCGSLLIMSGESQNEFMHCVEKQDRKQEGPRYSITFREHLG